MASLSDRPTHLSGEISDLAMRLTHTTDLDQLSLLSGIMDKVLARYYEVRETTQRGAREMPTFKVFVSSTYIDLKDHRRAVIDSLLRLKLQPVAMEFFGAEPEEPKQVCDNEIRGCDLFLGIYAHRYGFVPEESEKSITEQEFDLAQELGKPCFCYLIDEDHPWPPKLVEDEPGKSKLRAFKARIESVLVRDTFATPQELAGKVASDLGKWVAEHGAPIPSTPTIYHNLPQPDYGTFIGREEELAQVHHILQPYPHSQHALVTIDGIGGIGKSALALEVAHRYLRGYDRLPLEERFEAIIWTSAKSSLLTADGIKPRQQITRTLDDIYTTISVTLEREDITRAQPEERDALVIKALTQQRTLLIVDNLETVDDERVNAFLRELPAPTKAIVTTRHRIDMAYPVRLTGMPKEDGLALITQECAKKGVTLAEAAAEKLYDRTGGVPLAIVWSVAQMGYGYGVEAVIRRLGQPTGDIARFCFEGAVERIRGTDAHKLLMALSLFATDAGRDALGYVADWGADVLSRDQGLVILERLSLVNRGRSDRFWMLPLTKEYVASSLLDPATITHFRNFQVEYYLEHISRPSPFPLYPRELVSQVSDELENILDLLEWCMEQEDQGSLIELFLRIQDFLGVFGRLDLRVAWGEHAIRAARSAGSLADLGRLYASTMGWAYIKRGELDRARYWLGEGLQIIRQSGDQKMECAALRFLGRLTLIEGQARQARQIYEDVLATAKSKGFGGLVAALNSDLAYWEMRHGTLDKAEGYIRESVSGFEDLGDSVRASDRSIMLANILVRQGKYPEAEVRLLPSLERLEKELGQPEAVAAGYACLAHVRAHQGDLDEAIRCCNRARRIYDEVGMREEAFPIGLPKVCQQE